MSESLLPGRSQSLLSGLSQKATPFFLGAPDLGPREPGQPQGGPPNVHNHNNPKKTVLSPMPVLFDGTVPAGKDDAWNKKILDEAVFILSQSATGRDLLREITAAGYHIVFDDARTGGKGAGGLCDPTAKQIILHAHESPDYLALLLAHECVHAVQNTRHDLFPTSEHRPEEGIRLSFAIEADAYAQQVQVALELCHGDPARGPSQMTFDTPLSEMRRRFPDLTTAAEKALVSEQALTDGRAVTAAFHAFYNNLHLRTFYEDSHMNWAESCVPKKGGGLRKQFNKAADPDWIKEHIRHRGQPYLKKHAPKLSFDDARHAGVTEKTAMRIRRFYKDRLRKKPPEGLKIFGIHMTGASDWVYGLGGRVQAVFRKAGQNRKKPSAPARMKKII